MLKSDKLLYFKYEGSKKHSCQRGTILLKDCQIICPFLEHENRPVSVTVVSFVVVGLKMKSVVVGLCDNTLNLQILIISTTHVLTLLFSGFLCLIVGR